VFKNFTDAAADDDNNNNNNMHRRVLMQCTIHLTWEIILHEPEIQNYRIAATLYTLDTRFVASM
jgi:hypothetical protein